jgi:arylsulfatase A
MKLSMYEGGLRVPGVVRWPGRLKPGSECAEPIVFYDILPTLCAAAGVASPPGVLLDGVDVLPLLEGRPVERPVPLHWQYDNAQGGPWRNALRRGNWKLLADADRKRFALYDLATDIAEAHDRSADKPDVVRELVTELERIYVPAALTSRSR